MDAAAVISEILTDWDNVNALDADNAARRAKLLNELQRVFADVWNDRPWPFRFRSLPMLVVNGVSNVNVPSDFQESGMYGGLYLSFASGNTGEKLDYVNPYELLRIRETGGGSTSSPGIYSIFGIADGSSGKPQQFQFPTNPSTFSVDVFYYAIPPTLSDQTGDASGLIYIPAQWHELVIVQGLIAKVQRKKGDPSWKDFQAEYERSLGRMRAREMPGKDTTNQLNSFFNR